MPEGLLRAPLHRAGRKFTRWSTVHSLLIGGGTILGRDEWIARIQESVAILAPTRRVVFGAGVENPEFAQTRGIASPAGWRQLSRILSDFDFVGVRGPLSQEYLRQFGIDAEIVGDPALHMTDVLPTFARRDNRVVALNLAAVSDGFNHSGWESKTTLAALANRLKRDGLEPIFFCMERGDEEIAREVTGGAHLVVPWKRNGVADIAHLISGAGAVVAERLHGGILAASYGTPFLQVGYKPKTYDFVLSIGAEDLILDAKAEPVEELVGKVHTLMNSGFPADVQKNIDALKLRFLEHHRALAF